MNIKDFRVISRFTIVCLPLQLHLLPPRWGILEVQEWPLRFPIHVQNAQLNKRAKEYISFSLCDIELC